MFPVFSTEFLILITVIFLVLVFIFSVVFALFLNWMFRAPLKGYLVSSGVIAVVSYVVTTVILLYVLPPLHWINDQPQDLRTALWDNLGILASVSSLICFAAWQIVVRVRQIRRPNKHGL